MHRGGLERVVLDMARSLLRRKYRVSVAVAGKAGDMAAQCRASGIPVHVTDSDLSAFERLLDAESPDLLIPHYSFLGSPLAWRKGIPVLSFIHNSYIWTTEQEDATICNTDLYTTHYVAVSRTAASFFSRKYRVDRGKITSIPNGIDLDSTRLQPNSGPTRRDYGLDSKDFVIVSVASILGTKAQIHAIAAVGALKKEIPRIKLLLVGAEADSAYAAATRQFIREAGLSDTVYLSGHSDVVDAYYRIADMFLLSSLTEGWSLAKTEAMLHGLPLVLTDVGGAAEVITGSDIGILVPPAYDDPLTVNASNLMQL